MSHPVLIGVLVAAALALCGAMVAVVRWIRPNGELHLRRFVIANVVLVVLFIALAIAGLITRSWPTVGWSTALAIAMALSAFSKTRQAATRSTATQSTPPRR